MSLYILHIDIPLRRYPVHPPGSHRHFFGREELLFKSPKREGFEAVIRDFKEAGPMGGARPSDAPDPPPLHTPPPVFLQLLFFLRSAWFRVGWGIMDGFVWGSCA